MFNFLDKKQFFTIVIAGVVLFLLQKYLTKTVKLPNGEVKSYIGNDDLGTV